MNCWRSETDSATQDGGGRTRFVPACWSLVASRSSSRPEVVLLDALLRRSVPVEPQVPVECGDGITVHLDLGVPVVHWGIELDIHPEHRSVDGHHRDARRFRSLHVSSWQIEPVTEQDMLCVERLADELTALYHERAGATRVSSDPMWRAPELGSASGTRVIDCKT